MGTGQIESNGICIPEGSYSLANKIELQGFEECMNKVREHYTQNIKFDEPLAAPYVIAMHLCTNDNILESEYKQMAQGIINYYNASNDLGNPAHSTVAAFALNFRDFLFKQRSITGYENSINLFTFLTKNNDSDKDFWSSMVSPDVIVYKPALTSLNFCMFDYLKSPSEEFDRYIYAQLENGGVRIENIENSALGWLQKNKDTVGISSNRLDSKTMYSCVLQKLLNTNPGVAAELISKRIFDLRDSFYTSNKINPIELIRVNAYQTGNMNVFNALRKLPEYQGIRPFTVFEAAKNKVLDTIHSVNTEYNIFK